MVSGKNFYKRHSFITLIIALLIAAVAVPKTLALTARQAKKLDVQVEGEDVWGEAVEGVLVRKGSTTPNAPGLAGQPKSPAAALAPRDGDRTFGTQAPASRNTTLAIQPKLAASGSEAGLPGALDAEQTVAKSPIIYKLRLTQVLEDLQGKVFRHNDTADREILLEAEVLRVFKGDPKAAGQRVVLVWETLRRGSRLYSCLHAEQVVPKHASSGEAVYLMALTPAEPATDAEGRPRLKNIFCLDIMGTRVSKADVDPKKWATAKKTLERLKLELLSALDDPDANTRHSAIKGLRTWDGQKLTEEPPGGPLWKDERAAARILAASRDPDWRVRWVVAWMIPKEAAEEGEKTLVHLLSDTHREVRQVAAFVLRRRGREDLVKPLSDEPLTDPPPIRSTIPEPQGGRQRLDDQEKVILTTQRGEEAGGAEPDDRTPPVRPVSEAELDGKEILKKLKSFDAVYAAAFTASGTRPVWGRRKWKLTMSDGRIAYEEEVVEIDKAVAKRVRLRPGRPGDREGKQWFVFRSTVYVGPTAQAKYDWVGRIQRYGPQDPWPENGPGPTTTGSLDVFDPDPPAYMLDIRLTLWCLGRGYSRHITKIVEVSRQEDGRLKVAADGLDMALRPGAKWELVIEPDAEYMVRSAKMVDNRNRRSSYANSGLKRHGSHCVPEKGECKGSFFRASFEFQSASFKADTEFLKHAKDTMRPPYLIHTDVRDKRVSPGLYVSYDAGKLSPNGRIKDWDIGLEEPKQPATQWGEAVEGLRAAVEFVPEKKSYSLGERVGVRFHMQNVSNQIIHLATPRWWIRSSCFVEDQLGKKMPTRTVQEPWGITTIDRHKLLPGQVIKLESGSLAIVKDETQGNSFYKYPVRNVVTLKPGQYSLYYWLRFPGIKRLDGDGKVIVPQPDDWQGVLDTGKRKLVLTSTVESDQKSTRLRIQRREAKKGI